MADEEALRAMLGDGAAADELLRDRDIRAALARGPFELHAALLKARRGRLSDGARSALGNLTARRRAFARPIGKAPQMSTINGVGTRLYGRDEVDPADGTYVATLYFTLLFAPILPLASYVVADGQQKSGFFGGGRSWYFRSKVPLSDLHRMWRSAAFATSAATAALAAFTLLHSSTHSDVRFVNGLDVPVEITAGDVVEFVRPGAVAKRELSRGRRHVVARAAGRTIEEIDVDVPGGKNCVVYNVLGAAPIYDEGVVYARDAKSAPPDTPPPPFVDVSGPSFVVRDGVDDAFISPPRGVEFRSSDPPTKTRRHVDVAKGGWRAAVQSALRRGDAAGAAAIARRVTLAQPADAEASSFAAACFANTGEAAASLEFAEQLLARDPSSLDAHRTYQTAMQDAGRLDEVRAKYRAAFDADRDSARAGYLYARLAPFGEAAPVFERLVKLHPDDAPLRRALAWTFVHQRRFADALVQIEKFEAVAPAEAATVLIYHADALAVLGRVPEAQRLVRKFITKGEWVALMLYAELARLPGADGSMPAAATFFPLVADVKDPPVESLLAEQASWTHDAADFDARKDAVKDVHVRESCALRVLAFSDPGEGARRVEGAPKEAMVQLDDETRLALACELDRLGRVDAARAVYDGSSRALRRYLSFESIHDLPALGGVPEDVELETRAILEVAAARRTNDAAKRSELLDLARRDDVLRCILPR